MAINDLSFFSTLSTKMRWHEARQSVLAENVANADTPGYRGHDLAPVDFGTALAAQSGGPGPVTPRVTAAAHIAGRPMSADDGFNVADAPMFEVTPRGNAVVLEEEMMTVAGNQMDFQAASTLYGRGLSLIRLALGRSA